MSKHILSSKTFWTQIVAVASTAVPFIGDFLRDNPTGFVAVLGALNVVVRFFTRGRVSLFAD